MAEDNNKTLWPGWETVRVIGHGSFGTVYEIERNIFGQKEKAALKVITIPQNSSDIDEFRSNGYDDASITDTFKSYLKNIVDEYSLMRKLNGTANVVNCDDVWYVQHDDGYGWDIYIKMELVTPLTKALGKTAPEEQVIQIGKDICEALILCKRHNIVHRDIKPANIFVSENGDYKLGDFGIVKTVEKTSGGTKIGTYEYMAPEVYHDEPYGSSADIYSLGLVLYWLLNERRTPFLPLPPQLPTSSDKDLARKRRFGGEAIPAPAHGSKELQQIVLKACAYKPNDRFLNADAFLWALNKIGNKDSTAAEGRLETEDDESVYDGTRTEKAFNTEKNEERINKERTESETVGETSGEEGTGTVDIFNANKKIENDNNNSVVPPPPHPTPKKNWLVIGAIGCIIAIIALILKWNHSQVIVKSTSTSLPTQVKSSSSDTSALSMSSEEKAYAEAEVLLSQGNTARAAMAFYRIGNYNDAKKRSFDIWRSIIPTTTIAASIYHSVGVQTNGTVVATGQNYDGSCDVSNWRNIVAVAAGVYHTVGLRADGTVVATGYNYEGQCNVSGWKNIVAIAAGRYHTLGLRSDGTVVATEYEGNYENNYGQCDVSSWKDIVAIAAGGSHSVGLKADGTVVAIGFKRAGQCDVSGWKDIVSIAAGAVHTVGLCSDGTVIATNYTGDKSDYDGQCDVSAWSGIKAISAGWAHTIGLRANGTVIAKGYNYDGRCDVNNWGNIVAIAGGANTVGLRADGTVLAIGNNENRQSNVSDWRSIRIPE